MGNFGACTVKRQQIDDFCSQLFRTLDNLGLLPRQLWAKPNEFEKYPRLLVGSVQRYNDVEAVFKEWEIRVLRQDEVQYRREERYPELEALRRWMISNSDIFLKKANQQHLRTSLYARIFQYLYPRRVLVNAYCIKHKGNVGAAQADFVTEHLPKSVDAELQKLKETYLDEWVTITADAQASFIANAAYYRRVLRGDPPEAAPASELPVETEKMTEEKP
jgi:hypothetical protein